MEYPAGCTCASALSRLELYVRCTLSRVEALAIAEHLEACPPCAQRLAMLRWPAPDPLAGEAGRNV